MDCTIHISIATITAKKKCNWKINDAVTQIIVSLPFETTRYDKNTSLQRTHNPRKVTNYCVSCHKEYYTVNIVKSVILFCKKGCL